MSQSPIKSLSEEDQELYAHIESLVLNYQDEKSEENINALLHFFKPLLTKYVNIIKRGIVKWEDKNAQIFLYTFLGPHGSSKAEKQHIYQDKLRIMRLIFAQVPTEDVYAEMQLIFFILLNRYKPMDRSFCAYAGSSFPYEVARYVRRFTASQSAWHPRCDSFDEIGITECVTDEFLDTFEYFETVEEDLTIVDEFGNLNEEWIKRADSAAFINLTSVERQLIKMYYQDRNNDLEISQKLDFHINTINHKRRKAVSEVSKVVGVEPARNRNPKQEDRKGVVKIPKTAPIVIPLSIEKRVKASPCKECLHIKVCKHHEWYTKRIMVFNKSELLEDFDKDCFTASLDCLNYYKGA